MNLASYIDHTLLNPTATKAEITALCETAIEHQFKAVCIPESYLELGSQVLGDSSVALCTSLFQDTDCIILEMFSTSAGVLYLRTASK